MIDEPGVKLHETTDARVWAREFVRMHGAEENLIVADEHTIMAWFANAIETGRSAGASPYVLKEFLAGQSEDRV